MLTGMARRGVLVVMAGAIGLAFADGGVRAQGSFEDWQEEERARRASFDQGVTDAYEAFLRADSVAFVEFKSEIEDRWGDWVGSTKTLWVEYESDLNGRSVVDFETGEVSISVLVPEDQAQEDPGAINRELETAITKLVTNRGKSLDYDVADQRPQPLGEKPVLEGQLRLKNGEDVNEKNAKAFAEETVRASRSERVSIRSKDGAKRTKATVVLKLVPNHLRVRAERFLKLVRRYARKYRLDPRLVLAVIHTESYYNPKARSPAPAYGLMQLVPKSGARDAYRYVYGKDKLVSPNYLYSPENNIELGCAYLHILGDRYFGRIADPSARKYCVIAAYNTGPGNVSRGLCGSTNVPKAVDRANGWTPKELLARLVSNLPYAETRDYLKKVSSRIKIYDEWRR